MLLILSLGSIRPLTRSSKLYSDALDELGSTVGPAPFLGLPTLTKDFPVERRRPAEFGSVLTKGYHPDQDQAFWARLRAKGLMNVGRTACPEFGMACVTESSLYGTTRNPWDPALTPSGSSGGSAAAVAAGVVPFAHGNDGGGSIRMPASYCGVIGLKPSRGRVSGSPAPNSTLFGLAAEFFLTRSVRDTALLLDHISGPEAGDPFEIAAPPQPYLEVINKAPRKLRVAVCTRSWAGLSVDPEIVSATEAAGRHLESLGHHVECASPEFDYSSYLNAEKIIWSAFADQALRDLAQHLGRPVDATTLQSMTLALMDFGRTLRAADLSRAFETYEIVTRIVGRFLAQFDLLVTPTCPHLPEPVGTRFPGRPNITADDVIADWAVMESFCTLFNATGLPAVSLPLAQSAAGLPIGVQFVAPFGREDTLLSVAHALEAEVKWGARRPTIHVSRMPPRQVLTADRD